MSRVKGQLFKILKNKPTVITRAGFWKIPHNTREDEVSLKIGRYTKPKKNLRIFKVKNGMKKSNRKY